MPDQFGRLSGAELVQAMADFVNSAGPAQRENVAGEFLFIHRTLQAGVVDLAMQILRAVGSLTPVQTDARNEFAVKAARAGYVAMSEALNGAGHVSGA